MKKTLYFVALLLVFSTLFCACARSAHHDTDDTTDRATDTSDRAGETTPDPFASVRDSGEEWITYGLKAYEAGQTPSDLKEFFSDPANMSYLTLYDHMFAYDAERSIPVAEALFEFIYTEYGAEALPDADKRIEYKSAYLKSLGLDMEYLQSPEVEKLFIAMDFSAADAGEYTYTMTFGNVAYHFKDFRAGSPAQYHGFMYYNTTGLERLIAWLKDSNISDGFETDRNFDYYMSFDGTGYSITRYETGDMYINDSSSAPHEAVHAMGIGRESTDHIWLSEGLCNYLGKMLGFNEQIAASYIQILSMAKQGYFDERAAAGDKTAKAYKETYERFVRAGGEVGLSRDFDLRLYNTVVVKYELERGEYVTLGDVYRAINGKTCRSTGRELSYEQATSLVAYLVDTYGIEKVLDAQKTQDIAAAFGKNYEQLKEEWMATLA